VRHSDGDTNVVTDGDSHPDTNCDANGYSHSYTYTHGYAYTHGGNANAHAYLHTGRDAWVVDASHRLSPIGVWSGCG
jgi:hypothetical protein